MIHALFSRLGLFIILLVLQVFALFGVFRWFENILPHILGGVALYTVVMVLYLLNSRMDPTAKITWLIIVMILPVFGAMLYWFTKSEIGHKAIRGRIEQIGEQTKDCIPQNAEVLGRLKQENPGAASLARYLNRNDCHPVYDNTAVTYFPLGEDKWDEMLRQLEQAEHFIFMEYFIVDEGLMWGKFWMCWHGLFGLVLEGFGCLIQHGRWENHMIFIWEPLCGIYGYGAAGCCIGAILLKKLPLFDCFVLLSELYCRFRQEPCSTAPKVL